MDSPYEGVSLERRPCQGAIYRNIKVRIFGGTQKTESPDKEAVWSEWDLPYAVTLSQECDLFSHFRPSQGDNDKQLFSVLVCPAYLDDQFRNWVHLETLMRTMARQPSKPWDIIKQNKNPRYHYLASCPDLQVPSTVVDFKHFFTISVESLQDEYSSSEYFIARLKCPYREDISQRFASYLCRIGLPIPHHEIR